MMVYGFCETKICERDAFKTSDLIKVHIIIASRRDVVPKSLVMTCLKKFRGHDESS